MNRDFDHDVLVIGAGVTGVALARALAERAPSLSIAIVDKEGGVAAHTSGRNSGVAHGGYNPKPGTQKARFCVEGNRRLRAMCAEKGIACRQVGVLVVAQEQRELPTLETLYQRGVANGVEGIELWDAARLTAAEPNVNGIAALHAPTVAAVDSKQIVLALADEARTRGVHFLLGTRVERLHEVSGGIELECGERRLRARYVVNAAGLHADKLAHQLGVGRDYEIVPFRGEYYEVKAERRGIVQRMIYPVPDIEFPFLGIHFTPSAHDELLVGPNVVLALGREAYGKLDIDFAEFARIVMNSPFRQIFARYPKFVGFAWDFAKTSFSRAAFLREASKLVRGLTEDDLHAGHPPGIRAQLVRRDGTLMEDLLVEESPNVLHVLNVVSPGFTCGIPFGEHLAQTVAARLS